MNSAPALIDSFGRAPRSHERAALAREPELRGARPAAAVEFGNVADIIYKQHILYWVTKYHRGVGLENCFLRVNNFDETTF